MANLYRFLSLKAAFWTTFLLKQLSLQKTDKLACLSAQIKRWKQEKNEATFVSALKASVMWLSIFYPNGNQKFFVAEAQVH